MARSSPLLSQHKEAEALLETYGPPEAGVPVVQTFSDPDLEYAAVRKGCGLIDLPLRATIEVSGADRIEFLGRMLTQELKNFAPWTMRRSFWLSRKGRIDADLRLINLPDRLLVDVDVHAVARAVEGLTAYVIAEDCTIADRTEAMHCLALHGPAACALLAQASTHQAGEPVDTLRPGHVAMVSIAGYEVVVDRDDSAGEIGLELLVPATGVPQVWAHLVEIGCPGLEDPFGLTTPPFHMRPIGWAAYNIARIEAGTPWYYLDFGPNSLPHETSVLDSRVSFTKGCYLGQEIVARMQALGQPKQRLAAIKLQTGVLTTGNDPTADADVPEVLQPITGASVFAPPAGTAEGAPIRAGACGEPIGAVTSSAISPMLGGTPVCFAMVKTVHAAPGSALLVDCGGGLLWGKVGEGLRLWKR